ncbi:MAG: Fic family protein [Galactobacter sp.]
MDLSMFGASATGDLVAINGSHPRRGAWEHKAFVPTPLPNQLELHPSTYLSVANARAALAALDATSQQLPNPALFRMPSLRLEAQSTSELEGTYAPVPDVLVADEENPTTAELTEVLNYVRMANYGFHRIVGGWPITSSLLSELQGLLMEGTPKHADSGKLRTTQVVIGRREGMDPREFPVVAARFIPSPPGDQLEAGVRSLLDWMQQDHGSTLDPVIVAGLAHYQFETLHPFTDGNGRLGRFLIVVQFLLTGLLNEPTLMVSPWFESRRTEYYRCLLRVSTNGDWDGFLQLFAQGVGAAATSAREEMLALVKVQTELHEALRASRLRADTAHAVVDHAVANPSFTVRQLEKALEIKYGRANALVKQLVELGILDVVNPQPYSRRFYAPRVLEVLTQRA